MHLNLSDSSVHEPPTVSPRFLFAAAGKGRRERENGLSFQEQRGQQTDPFESQPCVSITRDKGARWGQLAGVYLICGGQ